MGQAAPPGVFGYQRVELSSHGTCSLSSKVQFHQLHGFPRAHVGLLVYQPLPTLLHMCHLKRVKIGTSQTRRSRGHRELQGAQYQEPLGIRKFRAVPPAPPPAGQRYSTEGWQDMSNGNSHHRVAGGVREGAAFQKTFGRYSIS